MNEVEVSEFIGKTLNNVFRFDDEQDVLRFEFSDGSIYQMFHEQECNEDVHIEDVTGDWADLIGVPLLVAEERTNEGVTLDQDEYVEGSFTWTFYEFRTIRGAVQVRWHGESSGYYSESVTIEKVGQEGAHQ